MYLVAHQNDCQMVVGNVKEVFVTNHKMILGMEKEMRVFPRQCTCEPQKINWEVLLRMIGGTRHKLADLYRMTQKHSIEDFIRMRSA